MIIYFLFQPACHNWCNKGCGMYYPVCGIDDKKTPYCSLKRESQQWVLSLTI